MRYFARTLFLLGTLLLSCGLCIFVGKILFNTYLPEDLKGYWVETCLAIIVGTLVASAAQLLGNDLVGPKRAIKKKSQEGYEAFRRQDKVTKALQVDDIFSSFLFLLKNMD